MHLHLLACVASRKRIRARPNRSCERPVFSELGKAVCEIGASGRARALHSWALSLGGPRRTYQAGVAACTRSVLVRDGDSGWFSAAGTATALMALGRTKSGVGGTSNRPRNSDKVVQYDGRVGRRMGSQARKNARRGAAPGRRVFAARRPSWLGRSGARPLTNFAFWGRLPPKSADALREQNES